MTALRFVLLGLAAFAVSAVQADTITSSASSAASQSVESLSDSVSGSSKSSSGDDKRAAAGAYRVTAVAQVEGKPEHLRLALAPAEGQAAGFALTLPAAIATQQGLQPGAMLWVQERAYGLAFAARAEAAPFFLAVDDRLRRDLESVKL